jgi:hypothetical protein
MDIRLMDRTRLRLVAALAAMFLVILCGGATADAGAADVDLGGTLAAADAGTAVGDTEDATAEVGVVENTPVGDGTVQGQADEAGADVTGEGSLEPAEQAPPATDTADTTAPATETSNSAAPTTDAATVPSAADNSTPAPEQPGGSPIVAAPEPVTIGSAAFSASEAMSPQPAAPAASTNSASRAGTHAPAGASRPAGLAQLLPTVEHSLAGVQRQIDDLQRRLDEGGSPSPVRLTRLRSSLALIAPALLELQRRLHAGGPLTSRDRALLRRIGAQLADTRVSAAALIAALRRSGMSGRELRLLLRELESFHAQQAVLAAGSVAGPAPLSLGAVPAGAPALPTLRAPVVLAPAEPRAAATRASAPRQPGGPERAPSSTPAPGSATASSGGSFSTAGLASLAVLLVGLALSQLRCRLAPSPGRWRPVVFLTPLERPG